MEDAADECERRDDDADEQRIAGAVDQAREDIAPDSVGAEQIGGGASLFPEGRQKVGVRQPLGRAIGRDHRRKDGRNNEEDENPQPDDGAAVLREIIPELRQHPAAH